MYNLLKSIKKRDPAANNLLEIIFFYQDFMQLFYIDLLTFYGY